MKKKISALIGIAACCAITVLPVCAETTRLDVKEGDRNSYYTYKDTYDYENYFYVTPETYIGDPLMGISVAQAGGHSSGWKSIYNERLRYSYDTPNVPGGIYYRLMTGPHAGTPANWHLTGRYTP